MSEPITVADALKALRMLKEVGEKATPGPWLLEEIEDILCVAVPCSAREKTPKCTDSGVHAHVAHWDLQSGESGCREDGAFIVAARAVLPGMVKYLLHGLSRHRPHDKLGAGVFYDAIAPIVQWARTREDWSR